MGSGRGRCVRRADCASPGRAGTAAPDPARASAACDRQKSPRPVERRAAVARVADGVAGGARRTALDRQRAPSQRPVDDRGGNVAGGPDHLRLCARRHGPAPGRRGGQYGSAPHPHADARAFAHCDDAGHDHGRRHAAHDLSGRAAGGREPARLGRRGRPDCRLRRQASIQQHDCRTAARADPADPARRCPDCRRRVGAGGGNLWHVRRDAAMG
ncbi:hypothetical protein LMG23992_00764 [Cupriavidus laharis]|uniref:Uncharacterized protein n=1 Tax=Cupriavidus laharis TaxID=151654 RepID=A0ABN7Y1Q9_9BURK|nr:hypothetical protein LMG23992_00764 [Cupriavidus laharis]